MKWNCETNDRQKQPPRRVLWKGVLRNYAKFTGKHLCQILFFNKIAGGACNFIEKETLAQVFPCEFSEISKNTFFYRTLLVATSGQRCSVKKLFLEISQNLPENTCVGVAFLIKFQALEFLKNNLQNLSGGYFFIEDFFLSIFCNEKGFKQIISNLLV